MPDSDSSASPETLAHQLRAAVLAGDHPMALKLVDQYSNALRDYWTTLTPAERAASSMPQQSLELLKWVRDMTLMQRGMLSDHCKILKKSMRYQAARMQYLQSAAVDSH